MRERSPLIPFLAAALAVIAPASAQNPRDGQDFSQIERGRYLATLADCAACHTVPGGKPYAGGRPIETPFGILLGPNITPDRDTGIGAWSDDEFVNSLTKGTGRNGEHLYPAMPYVYMTRMSRDEALAVRAYLGTIEPVSNRVVSNQLPFPFDVRASLLAWDSLNFREGEFKPVAGKSAEWNRGAYIVEGPAHCGACHTPKDVLGGDKRAEALRGYPLQGWFAPNITNQARQGLDAWSQDDIVEYLGTGHNRFAAAAGPMAEEVALSSSHMTAEDLRAIAVYLKDQSVPEDGSPAPIDGKTPAMVAGEAIYRDACAACHKVNGEGIAELFPELKGLPSLQSRDVTSVTRVILRGTASVATDGAPTGPQMPAFGWQLDDEQVAAVATFVRNAWGNAAPAVSAAEVRSARADLAKRGE